MASLEVVAVYLFYPASRPGLDAHFFTLFHSRCPGSCVVVALACARGTKSSAWEG